MKGKHYKELNTHLLCEVHLLRQIRLKEHKLQLLYTLPIGKDITRHSNSDIIVADFSDS